MGTLQVKVLETTRQNIRLFWINDPEPCLVLTQLSSGT